MFLKSRPPHFVYCAPDDGTNQGSTAPVDPNDPAVQALIQAEATKAIAAIKAKNDELIAEKRKLQEFASTFEGIDKDTLKNYMERLKNDEETRLIAEGKIDEVMARRTDRMRETYQSQIEERAKALEDANARFQRLEQEFNQSKIEAAVRDAATAAKVEPTAIDDVLARARSHFTLIEGRLVSKDQHTGEIRIGADGKSPYSPVDFMEDLKKSAPHFWPRSTSGGFTGPGGAAAASDQAQAALARGDFAEYKRLRNKMLADKK